MVSGACTAFVFMSLSSGAGRSMRSSETQSMCVRQMTGWVVFASAADGAMRDRMDGSDGRTRGERGFSVSLTVWRV